MSSVRNRVLFLVILTLATLGGLSERIYRVHDHLLSTHRGIEQSWLLEEQAVRLLNAKLAAAASMAELRTLGQHLEPSQRGEAWGRLMAAAEDKNASAVRSRTDAVQQIEHDFRAHQSGVLPYFERQLQLYAALLGGTVLLSLFLIVLQLKLGVFGPIRVLSRKMGDFLNDRYTYQFSVPSPTEVGHLQATFNALAQRVLSNMEGLADLDRAKSEFLSIASHELRTPLTSIKGSLSLLKSGVVGEMNDMAKNLLNIAESETDRLIRLINELLDLAKIESGKFTVHPEWQSMNEVVQRTFNSLQGLAKTADVHLVATDLPPVQSRVDRDCIQQVLTNLLSNAIKFSPAGSAVEVSFEIDSEQMLVVKVTDHGRGIAPEDQELIFQKFRQATSAKNPLVKGTGLGLAIAKALVEEHGGTIGVKSSPGHGSTFYFTLIEWKYSLKQSETPTVSPSTGAAA